MSLLLRAIVRADDADQAGEPDLVVIRAGSLAALASVCERAPAASAASLRIHEAITGRVHERVASLPARFGSVFGDADALRRALTARHDELASALGRVDGRIELAITLTWRAPRADMGVAAASGREYLERSAARERERREAEETVERLLGELACERAFTRHHICPRDGVAASMALLIRREEETAVRQRVESFVGRSRDLGASVYGPLPPYSFAS